MAPQDVRAQLAGGEGPAVEFKSSLADSRKLIETLAAMATIGGGAVLIGVRDDGTPIGATLGEGEHERLVQQVLANTDPRLFIELDEPEVEGKRLLRITVPAGDGPHLAFGRAFHRIGRATVAMTRDEYERRLLDRLRESSGFERRLVEGSSERDLSATAFEHWLARAKARLERVPSTAREAVERLHLFRSEGLTTAGWLLFSSDPQGPFPQAVIRARARRGEAEDVASIEGALGQQLDAAAAFVARNLKTRARIQSAGRREQTELPLVAVREALANAVAHRDYRSTAPIQLELTDEGLTIWNPGQLPPPLTAASLREQHPSVPPNPLLARALYLAGYIEEWGTGSLRIIEELERNGNPSPIFQADAAGVRATLPLEQPSEPASARARSALKRLRVGKPFSSAEYAQAAKVSVRTAAMDLALLAQQGFVKRQGVGRATRWVRV